MFFVHYAGKWRSFDTVEEAKNHVAFIFSITGVICTITDKKF